jgi:hypothetical protein
MKNPALELHEELLRMEKITDSTEVSVNLLKAMNNALLAGTSPEAIIKRLRKMKIETQDSLSGKKVFDM